MYFYYLALCALVTALIILSFSFVFLIFYYQTKHGFHEAGPDISRLAPITFSPTRAPSSDRTNSDISGNSGNNNVLGIYICHLFGRMTPALIFQLSN